MNKSSDKEAREYLRQLNLRLRQHLKDFPRHYNDPKRLPGQKGPLRKPKQIDSVQVNWSDEE